MGKGLREWPTLLALVLCYAAWIAALWLLPAWAAVPALAVILAFHSSLSHEALHGHPFPSAFANSFVVFPALGLWVPYLRFRDTHLAHHEDSRLTDPYDDPETNYVCPQMWARLPRASQRLLEWNNTLLGRLVIGPVIGQIMFMRADWKDRANLAVRRGWAVHLLALVPVLMCVWISDTSLWTYVIASYFALSLLKIRTFAEHLAAEHFAHRTVVIEDRGWLAFLFLNNNLHVVHHMKPAVPWYDLSALYASDKQRYLSRNGGYVFANYRALFARYFLRAKDPVAHPLWQPPPD